MGGISGAATSISDSYNTGKISGGEYRGGIAGSSQGSFYSYKFNLSLENCYSTTTPTGGDSTKTGGIIGLLDQDIQNANISKVYFVNSSSLPTDGYSQVSSGKPGNGVNRTVTVGDLATLHTEFDTTVWGTKDGRPVIKELGEGVGIN